ncbi:hypothetical protein CATMIT_01559, partial [Catenibacterium mitsuokai DSM 15897]
MAELELAGTVQRHREFVAQLALVAGGKPGQAERRGVRGEVGERLGHARAAFLARELRIGEHLAAAEVAIRPAV